VTGWEMAHRPSNRQRNGWLVSLLGVRAADEIENLLPRAG
jgi:hypothetical protein